MVLTVDWDYYSGSIEHTFDSPLWGTNDQEYDRLEYWYKRAYKRTAQAQSWQVLEHDYPLYGEPKELLQYKDCPTFVAWSHAHIWTLLKRFESFTVMNFDSHHDLYSQSGESLKVRPGNWAGLALKEGLIKDYICCYPTWHANVRVAEGFDLSRTWDEVCGHLLPDTCSRIRLERGGDWPHPKQVEALLLVQSPAWTSPAHDDVFFELLRKLRAEVLSNPYSRPFLLTSKE